MLPLLQQRRKRKGACDEHGDGRLVSVPLYSQEERALFEAHPLALQTMGHIEAMRNAAARRLRSCRTSTRTGPCARAWCWRCA